MHKLKALPENVHLGFYSADLKPVLTIRSGDEVEIETSRAERLDRGSGPMRAEMAALAEKKEREGFMGPHALTGPVYVEGAEPGDVVEVRIKAVQLRCEYAVNYYTPSGILSKEFSKPYTKMFFCIDPERNMAENAYAGVSLPLHPFFGNLGMAPPAKLGRVNSVAPGIHGGNLDIKELTAGTAIYLPVHVKGGLFSCGDGHACQADGEADGTALETPLTGVFQLTVRKDLKLKQLWAETPTHYMTIAYHKNLKSAAKLALKDMIRFLVQTRNLTEEDAYVLVSLAGEMHVSQLVNIIPGVHFMLPKGIFH